MHEYVKASRLPKRFRIPSTYHAAGEATAVQTAVHTIVQWLGVTVVLPRNARVMVQR